MTDDRKKKNECINLAKKIGIVVAGLFLLYVVIGFWVVPPLLRPKLEARLSDLLGRKVTIAEIKLNPVVLSATTSGLTVHEVDGQPFAGFEELYANTQISSIFKWAFTVREIRVQGPFCVLKLLPDNKLNIDDILAKLSAPKPEPKEEAGLPRASIEKFQVINGRASVENLSGKEPILEEMTPISFTIANLSTLEGRQGEYRFTGVGPMGGQFEVDGQITVNPVKVNGNLTITNTQISHYWEHLKDHVSFQIISGTTDLSGEYTLEIVDGQLNAKLENGVFKLDDFKLVEKGKQAVLIALPAFSIKGIDIDLQARETNVELIQTADGRIQSWLSPEGTFELQGLFLQDFKTLTKKRKTDEPAHQPAPAPPWQVVLKKMESKNWELTFEDRTLTPPVKLSADKIDVVVEDLTNKKDKTATLDVSMRINHAGNFKIKGKAGIVPLQADLDVVTDKISLKSFQTYVDDAFNAQIASGTTSSKGHIRYRGKGHQPQIQYEGDFSVEGVKIQDRVQSEDFITLTHLKSRGIGLELRPNKLNVSQILIDRPHARITIDKAGVVNVIHSLAPVEKEKQEEENLLKRLANFLILQFKGPMPMAVDRVQLKRFTGDFVDTSISPSYETHVEITDATATGLSSDTHVKADFNFNGSIGGKGRLEGSGQMNPMSALQYSKLNVSVNNFALNPVSPYSGKFIGFKIDNGTLHTKLKYQVANDNVDGTNIITIDQLELGERVDSPDALNLPIKLGVTLLKDREGRIKVQVPVKGNVKDPQFDFAKAIGSALTGTIEDVSRSPFAAIAEVDGFTGEELSTVAFEFGFSELKNREIQKLNALATLLIERKALTLGIVGTADRQMDGTVIMENSQQQTPADEDSEAAEATPGVETLAGQVDDVRLEQLAQQRAEAVINYLIERAGIDAARMHVQPVQIKTELDGEKGLVEFSLSVE